MDGNPIILFDGVCNLCNTSVQYIIKHDPAAIFQFASLQSEKGKSILKEYNLSETILASIVLIQDNKFYIRSTAALLIAKRLKGISKLLYGFIIVPAFIRNGVYDYIARNRYKWFGKKDECMIPTQALRSRFLN